MEAPMSQQHQEQTLVPKARAPSHKLKPEALNPRSLGIMEKRPETTIVDWGYIGIMEKRVETIIVYCI